MQIRKVQTLRGPNIWANFPVLEAWVDLGALKDCASDELSGFNERLKAFLPSLIEHRCSVGERGGFFERLRRGTYLAHILEHVVLELQTLAGSDCGFGRTRESNEDGVYKVAIEYQEETLCRAALEAGRELCLAAVDDQQFDVDSTIKRLRSLYENTRLGPSTDAIVNAALQRGIPVRRLNDGSLVQLGWGSKQRRILASETDRTTAMAETIAQDKELTRSLLHSIAVPVPEGRPVENAADAWEAAAEIGLPVVVKPRYGNQGRGVATNLRTQEQVTAAYAAAREESRNIIVEKHATGGDFRLLIVGDKLVAAAQRQPAQVTGDGQHTIQALVDEVNSDPRRGEDHATCLSKIPLDAVSLQVLAEQGYTLDSIPAAGQQVLIRRNANLSTGGTAADVTDFVHPEIAARAIEAARMVGLDVAGVDVVCENIGRPLEQQSGVIVEVNAAPGLRMHLQPSKGQPQSVGETIISTMFPEGHNGRIPVVAVTGVNGKTTTTRFIAHIVRQTGRKVGMTCTEGIFLDDRRLETGDCSGPQSAQKLLMNPGVDAVVLETARGGILRAGLAFDRCDVAVVTNIGEGDHLGLNDIETLDKLARVKRVPVEAVSKGGTAVLNAADPLTAEMAKSCPGSVLFFAIDPQHPVLLQHCAAGGRAVSVHDGIIVLTEGNHEIPLMPIDRVPLTHGGRAGFQVENTLAAVGAAWSLGFTREIIRAGLETFAAGLEYVPGRFNLLEVNGAAVVVDYGHNPSSLMAILDVLKVFPHQNRIAVYTAAGDRRDVDMVRQGELLGEAFDRVILYEDHYVRGRTPGEIMTRFREGLSRAQRVEHIEEVFGAIKAIEAALSVLQPGDLLLLQADTVDETVDYVRRYLATNQTAREVTLPEALATAPVLAPVVTGEPIAASADSGVIPIR
ncbi:MAG TPA: cyanophycin synthetase [Pirellulales bacterium]|jgi:cyanophycin synthetase|nr:cyanophycin synthetase [Pirellulales bacterium]